MTGKSGKGASERQLIEQVLAVIQKRLAAAEKLNSASLQNSDFMRRRFDEVLEDLALAHETIADLTEQLYGEALAAPTPLRRALRSRSRALQPVRLDVGGISRTFMVPPQGRDDPAAAARLWRQLRQRYGGDSA